MSGWLIFLLFFFWGGLGFFMLQVEFIQLNPNRKDFLMKKRVIFDACPRIESQSIIPHLNSFFVVLRK